MIKKIANESLELLMDIETEYEAHRFDTFFTKEPETIDWIKTLFNEYEVVYDVGANIGIYSLYASIYFKDKINVYAFEPAYCNFAKLCQNILINKFNNLKPYCLALGNKTTFEDIYLVSEIPGSANHYLKSADKMEYKFKQGIFCSSLDDLVYKFNFPKPNHIKIDVDGLEELIIKGAGKLLADSSLKSILIEITNTDNKKQTILQEILKYGFNNNHPINFQENHSRKRREEKMSNIENIIFTR